MEVINAEVLACWLAEKGRHMLNSADDLRDRAFVTYRAFCLALCYGHVSPWEPAALSKSPGFKAAQSDQGLGIGPVPRNKEHPKHLAQRTSDSISLFYNPSLTLSFSCLSLSLTWPVSLLCLIPGSVTELHTASLPQRLWVSPRFSALSAHSNISLDIYLFLLSWSQLTSFLSVYCTSSTSARHTLLSLLLLSSPPFSSLLLPFKSQKRSLSIFSPPRDYG